MAEALGAQPRPAPQRGPLPFTPASETEATQATPRRHQPRSNDRGPKLPITAEKQESLSSLQLEGPNSTACPHESPFLLRQTKNRYRVDDSPEIFTKQDRRPCRVWLGHLRHSIYSGCTGLSLSTSQQAAPWPHSAQRLPSLTSPVCLACFPSSEGLCQAARCWVSTEPAPEGRRPSASTVDVGPHCLGSGGLSLPPA